MHYPGKHNNDNRPNDEKFKDKSVINQPAGNIEFVNTKGEESVSVTHKSGTSTKFDKNGKDELITRDERKHVIGDVLENTGGEKVTITEENEEALILGDKIEKIGDIDKWQKPMEEIKKLLKEEHDVKRLFETNRTDSHNSIDQAPGQSKSGSHASCPTHSTKSKMIKSSSSATVQSTSVNSRNVINVQDGQETYEEVSPSGNTCLTCWGKMLSPSTQDGNWASNSDKQNLISKKVELQKKLYDQEKLLGQNKCPSGGNHLRIIAKDFIENIGLVFNDFESFRKDPNGKLVPCGIKIDPMGATIYTQYRDVSLVEQVDVQKFPGGTYELNVCDGWIATVGSNGMNLKTTGPINMYGTLLTLVGESVILNSRSNLSLGGEHVDITGDVITIRPRKTSRTLATGGQAESEQQVLIDGNLNIGLNAIIKGGAHVEGELTLHHITAPCEYQITETDFTYGQKIEPQQLPNPDSRLCAFGINGYSQTASSPEEQETASKSPTYATLLAGAHIGKAVGYDSNQQPLCLDVYSLKSENFAVVDEHVHYFKNVPLKLIDKDAQINNSVGAINGSGSANPHDAVRAIGSRNNWPMPIVAQPIENSKSPGSVATKFGGSDEPLQLNKSDWTESASDETLPSGEGMRTKKYTSEEIQNKISKIENMVEQKYKELKSMLADLSSLKTEIDNIS